MIENTSNRDPLLHLMASMSDGTSGYITGMEAAGQRQIVASEVLPSDLSDDGRQRLETAGAVFGEPVQGDGLFVHVTLPPGWKREGSEHAMWSYILDEHGRRRVSVFYKAAFYDRSAHASVYTLGRYVADVITGDSPLVLDDWVTREGLSAAVDELIEQLTEEAQQFAGYVERDPVPEWARGALDRTRTDLAALEKLKTRIAEEDS